MRRYHKYCSLSSHTLHHIALHHTLCRQCGNSTLLHLCGEDVPGVILNRPIGLDLSYILFLESDGRKSGEDGGLGNGDSEGQGEGMQTR